MFCSSIKHCTCQEKSWCSWVALVFDDVLDVPNIDPVRSVRCSFLFSSGLFPCGFPFPFFCLFSLPSWVSPPPPLPPRSCSWSFPLFCPVLSLLFPFLPLFSSLGCFFLSFLSSFSLSPVLSFPFLPFLFSSLLFPCFPFPFSPFCLLLFCFPFLPWWSSLLPLSWVLLVSSVCPFSRVCSFGSIKLALPSSLGREAMDRSRSPHRSAAPVAGTRPLVNFPVWSGPNTSDNNPRGTSLPPSQTPTLQWAQGSRGLQPSHGLPMTQDSQQIPPGQVGQSQQLMGLSQQSYHTPQAQAPVAPRPQVHGIGLGGMVPTFPPTPPTWTSSQFPGQFHGHFRPPHYGQGTPPSQRPTQTTPSSRSNSGTPYTPGKQPLGRIPNIPLGQHWKPDEEHYDSQKLNGLTLPRTIRSSSWTQLKDIEGCDPLTVPLSKLLYQGSENFWLRKLAAGREVYVATMGEVSQVVFVSEILSQLRSRGIDLDKLAQHKALQDGHALEKREAIQSLAKQIGDQLQRWAPTTQADTSSQHKIAELEARLAALQAAANQPPAAASQQAQVPAQAPEAPSPSPRVQSPIEAAFQGQRPTVFDPAQLLVSPGSNNQWLENNMIDTLSDSKYKSWFKNLKLDNATRQTIERNIVAVDNWWQNQPEEAEATIHRVAVCSGIPPAKIKSGQNENLLKVLTVALTMTAWLCTVLKRTSCMAQVAPALRLCKHQITILATLTPLTLSSSINIFFAFRILQTRLMILYSLHCPNFNSKLGALLRGATCLRHLYGTTITAHQQFSRSFFEPCTVYLRFCHVLRLQPLFYIGSTAENTLEREHTRFRKKHGKKYGIYGSFTEIDVGFPSTGTSYYHQYEPYLHLTKTLNHYSNFSTIEHTSESQTTYTTYWFCPAATTVQKQSEISFDKGEQVLKKIQIKKEEKIKVQGATQDKTPWFYKEKSLCTRTQRAWIFELQKAPCTWLAEYTYLSTDNPHFTSLRPWKKPPSLSKIQYLPPIASRWQIHCLQKRTRKAWQSKRLHTKINFSKPSKGNYDQPEVEIKNQRPTHLPIQPKILSSQTCTSYTSSKTWQENKTWMGPRSFCIRDCSWIYTAGYSTCWNWRSRLASTIPGTWWWRWTRWFGWHDAYSYSQTNGWGLGDLRQKSLWWHFSNKSTMWDPSYGCCCTAHYY